MKHKKIFITIYIAILLLISTILLNRIYGESEGNNANILGASPSNNAYEYEVKEKEGKIIERSVTGSHISEWKIAGIEQYAKGTKEYDYLEEDYEFNGYYDDKKTGLQGFYMRELYRFWDLFCLNKKMYLPSRVEEQTIKEMKYISDEASALGSLYFNADKTVASGIGRDVIEINMTKDEYDETKYYISRIVDLNKLNVKEIDKIEDSAQAYIMSQVDPEEIKKDFHSDYGYERNRYQLALWQTTNEDFNINTFDKYEDENGFHHYMDIKIDNFSREKGLEIYAKSQAFKLYRDEFKKNKEKPITVSSDSPYTLKYNASGYYIAGPIKIDYGDLTSKYEYDYEDSNLTVTKKTAEIEVKKIVNYNLYGTYIDPTTGKKDIKQINRNYIQFIDKDGNKLNDTNPVKDGGIFPKSGKEFYIKIDKKVYQEGIKGIKSFKVNFEYLDVEATGCEIKDESDGAVGFYLWYFDQSEMKLKRYTAPFVKEQIQTVIFLGKGELFWKPYELEITFNDLPTCLDLGGKVWVDLPKDNGKLIGDTDGIFKENTREYGRQNVLVELFFSDGTPVKVGVNNVEADIKNANLINPANNEKVLYNNTNVGYAMYTDSDGNYMFYGLPVDQKYFVRFTYDGQTYEKVLYLAGGDETDYQNNPNQEKYVNTSKVKDETDRTVFNKRFEKITYSNIGTRGTGQAVGTSPLLKYLDKKYEDLYIKSKIITTDNNRDAEYGEPTEKVEKPTGKAIDPFKIQASTALTYPLDNISDTTYLQHINLGLRIREKADFQLSTQIKAGATTIKDKEKVVIYPQSAKMSDLENDFTRQEDEYIKQEISAADYNWASEVSKIYNGKENEYFIVDKDKLHVYVLYRIAIKNQCDDSNDYGIINEIIDYYDNRLERVTETDEIARASRLFRDAGLKVSLTAYDSWIEGTNTQVNWTNSSTVGNYQMMKSTTSIRVGEGNSESAIYLILKVKDNGDVLYKGGEENEQTGMQNIAEIGSYSVYNNNGTVSDKNDDYTVGKIDKDSAPGNAIPGNKETYEDDTCSSPMFKLIINWTPKKIEGIVWDDVAPGSEGTYALGDKGVDGVTVKLVEYIVEKNSDGTYSVKHEIERPGIEINGKNLTVNQNQSVKTKDGGKYNFYVEGGNYSLKFIYGNEEMLQENKKYNAQDYQALNPPNYKALSGTEVPGYNEKNKKLNAFATSDELTNAYTNFLVVGQEGNKSDLGWNIDAIFGPKDDKKTQAQEETVGVPTTKYNNYSNVRDKANIRADIIRNTQELTYSNASILNKLNPDEVLTSSDAKALNKYTYMEAVSDIITIASNDLITEPNVINFGLKERPLATRKLEKAIKRIKLTASDGTVLVDTADNTKLSGLQNIDGKFQETFINLDPRVMDGALLDIDYEIVVTNSSVGNDCLQNYVYVNNARDKDTETLEKLRNELYPAYNLNTPLPIRVTIFDYVNINLEYRAEDNSNGTIWDNIYEESGNTGNSINGIKDGWLSDAAKEGIKRTQKKVSKVLQTHTDKFDNDGLLAGESVTIPIHLGITLSEDTSGKNLNDFDFSNCAELTKITTTAGRRDYKTVPGDYIPYNTEAANKKQPDAFLTGTTAITPPLGEGRFYYVIAIVSATIVLVGIILIKKKVLKK